MAKNRNKPRQPAQEGQGESKPRAPAPADQTAAGPSVWLRLVISLLILWHLFVVFVSPLSVQPASILVAEVAQSPFVRWYSDPLYLNHGYHFFGPDPPVNQLMRYRVYDTGGAVITEGEFPNQEQQRPRLYYHRHMMLADQANLGPPEIPAEEWLRLSMRAYARLLLRRHGGERVEVDCVRHLPLYPSQVLAEVDPNAPELFEPVVSIDENAAGLSQPLPVPGAPDRETATAPAELVPSGGDR